MLNDKEKAYKKLLIQTLNKYATTYSGKRFVGQGFLPRERKTDIDSRWAATNALGMFGVSYKSATASDDFYDNVDYSHDREAEMKMLQLIKDKGSQKLKKLPLRQSFNSEAEYQKELAKKEGIFVGISSGAAIQAAKNIAARGEKGNIVVILPDGGMKYISTELCND